MAVTQCVPFGVILAEGCDIMVDPPPTASHLRQTEWLQRRHPEEYVPPALISSELLEQSQAVQPYPTDCITSCLMEQDLLLFSAAGPSRELISLAQLPIAPNGDRLGIDGAAGGPVPTYRPRYVRATGPILQLVLNYRVPKGWEGVCFGADATLPLLAARSLVGIDFWRVVRRCQGESVAPRDVSISNQDQQQHVMTAGGEATDPCWMLRSIGHVPFSKSTGAKIKINQIQSSISPVTDFAWCRRMPQRGVIVHSNGAVMEVVVDPGNLGNLGRVTCTPAWIPGSELEHLVSPSSLGVVKAVFLPDHPRRLVLSLKTKIGTVDLRGPSAPPSPFQEIYTCPQGQWITSLAAAPEPQYSYGSEFATENNSTSSISEHQHLVAAATTSKILLFDLRRPQRPLASWPHGMGPGSKPHTLLELRTAGPCTLRWLPPYCRDGDVPHQNGSGNNSNEGNRDVSMIAIGRVLAMQVSHDGHARCVVCEWECEHSVGLLTAENGCIYALPPLRCRTRESATAPTATATATADEEEEEECTGASPPRCGNNSRRSGRGVFSWEPASWISFKSIDPPLLLFDTALHYPAALTAATKHGRAMQEVRRRRRTLFTAVQREENETTNLRINKPTSLLPSSWRGPLSLGLAIMDDSWQTVRKESRRGGAVSAEPMLAMLSSSQEITLMKLQSSSPSHHATATGAGAGGDGDGGLNEICSSRLIVLHPSTRDASLSEEEERNGCDAREQTLMELAKVVSSGSTIPKFKTRPSTLCIVCCRSSIGAFSFHLSALF